MQCPGIRLFTALLQDFSGGIDGVAARAISVIAAHVGLPTGGVFSSRQEIRDYFQAVGLRSERGEGRE